MSTVNAFGDIDAPGKFMICQTCRIPLMRITSFDDGEVTWVHTRSWQDHGHDPVPLAVDREFDKIETQCDFCGFVGIQHWAYTGDRVQIPPTAVDNMLRDYGHTWSACQHCAPFIDANDIPGLVRRVKAVSGVLKGLSAAEKDELSEAWPMLWRAFLPTIYQRKYIGPRRVPAKLTPRMMPKLQDGLLRFWGSEVVRERISTVPNGMSLPVPGLHVGDEDTFLHRYQPGQQIPRTVWDNHAQHLRAGIGVSSLYWISSQFTTLATLAGKDLETVEISREQLPAPFGFMMFEDPIGEVHRPSGVAAIRGVTWTLVPGGVWLNLYFQGEDGDPEIDVESMRQEKGYLLCGNTGSGLQFNDPITNVPEQFAFIQTIIATWFLLNQPGVAETTTAPVDKKLARSYARAGKKLSPVQLVDLRKQPRRSTSTDGGTGRPLMYRVYRKGHWKEQAYGPKHGLRRPIYVNQYIAGPDGAPLKTPTTKVNLLR